MSASTMPGHAAIEQRCDALRRSAGHALATFQMARSAVSVAHARLEVTTRDADTERIRAEVAADACRLARERLAECQQDGAPVPARGDAPVRDDEPATRRPLLVERLVRGDRDALTTAAERVAERTGRDPTACLLLLQELVEAIEDRAADDGFLDFDPEHPFWGPFDRTELRTMVRVLAGMGFRYARGEGWVGDRRPTPADLALAVAYIGYDARGLRGVPSGKEIDSLLGGAVVAADEFLGQRAPSLELDQMLGLLGRQAESLDGLWDDRAKLRPILLADA